jgi:NAD-specific glutamate dehydrogenase
VRAWLIANDILAINERTITLKAGAATMTAEAEIEAFRALERSCRAATGWALGNVDSALPVGAALARFKPPFDALLESFEHKLLESERARFEGIYRELRTSVADGELAHGLARLAFADHLLTIIGIAFDRDETPDRVMEAYFGLSAQLDFAILEQGILAVASDDRWIQRAVQELGAELRAARVTLCRAVLDAHVTGIEEALKQLKAAREERFAEVERLLSELAALQPLTPAAMHVTIRALTRLARAEQQ